MPSSTSLPLPELPSAQSARQVLGVVGDSTAYLLDAVEAVVKHPGISIRGMLLTLKLPDLALVEELATEFRWRTESPEWAEAVATARSGAVFVLPSVGPFTVYLYRGYGREVGEVAKGVGVNGAPLFGRIALLFSIFTAARSGEGAVR